MKWLLLSAGFAVLFAVGRLTQLAAAPEQERLAFVDLSRALEETNAGRSAKAALQKELESKQKQLDERQRQLKSDIEDFNKKRSLLSPEAVSKKEQELGSRMQAAQELYLQHTNALQKKQVDALRPLHERMERLVTTIAAAENLTMVFERHRSALVFAKPHLDITNELIRRLNAGEGSKNPTRR